MNTVDFLTFVNKTYYRLHYRYETLFWESYMGIRDVGQQKDRALVALDAFRGNRAHKATAEALAQKAKGRTKERLDTWVRFFAQYQIPETALPLRNKINKLETLIQQKRATRQEGYIDPATGTFVSASTLKMMSMIATHSDEAVRRACFEAREALAIDCLSEYVSLVSLRNEFARLLGYDDFYDYKLRHIDGMTKAELFGIFETIATAAKSDLVAIRAHEKVQSGLRKPWNFVYFTSGDFTKEEDQYFPFVEAVSRWLQSFQKLGINFAGGTLRLDLVERTGKYNNGFCHWPKLVMYEKGKRLPGSAQFTCNVVPGQVGSGELAYKTLFHEGGHAAHFLNITERDVCLNHEYAPMTAAWAETQSMFIDTIFSSYEWRSRYAKNAGGHAYPLDLLRRKTEAGALTRTRDIMSIIFMATFERRVYELKTPTADAIKRIAKQVYCEIFDHSVDSLRALNTPHIYAWESACSYHGYGLARVALYQWRTYFKKKYGSIVDNKAVGRELKAAWSWGARYDFKTAVRKVTGKPLSATSLIAEVTRTPKDIIREAKKYSTQISKAVPTNLQTVATTITLVHGKQKIADSSKGIPAMVKKYKSWYERLV
ncbi:MAG: oligoendopeptidase [Candidatus Parcubacteria bacterium]|jgi:hypothetical protein